MAFVPSMVSPCVAWFAGNCCRWGVWLLIGLLSGSCSSPKALFRFAPPVVRGAAPDAPACSVAKYAARLPLAFIEPTRSERRFRRVSGSHIMRHAVTAREFNRRPTRFTEPAFRQPVVLPRTEPTATRLQISRPFPVTQPENNFPPPPAANTGTPGFLKAAGLFALGGVLIAGAGIMLGIGVGGGWGLLLGLGGLVVGLLCGMAGVFGATVRENYAKPRFNAVTLLGLLLPLGGVALDWGVGGLVGIGLGVGLLGLGAVLVGLGIALGMPDQPTAAPAPGTK